MSAYRDRILLDRTDCSVRGPREGLQESWSSTLFMIDHPPSGLGLGVDGASNRNAVVNRQLIPGRNASQNWQPITSPLLNPAFPTNRTAQINCMALSITIHKSQCYTKPWMAQILLHYRQSTNRQTNGEAA